MVGRWSDGVVEEQWFQAVGDRMIGVNRHLEDGRFEYLRIELRDGQPVYVASPMGGAEATFTASNVGEQQVVFQNPRHDFPTDISYRIDGGEMVARVSGGTRELAWRWRRIPAPQWSTAPGRVGWLDLAVPDAIATRDFYCKVIGWTSVPTSMGGYEDFSGVAPDGTTVAGMCHARGDNAAIPPGWLPYFMVTDRDTAVASALALGAEQVFTAGSVSILRDPDGVPFALFEA